MTYDILTYIHMYVYVLSIHTYVCTYVSLDQSFSSSLALRLPLYFVACRLVYKRYSCGATFTISSPIFNISREKRNKHFPSQRFGFSTV